MIDYTLPSSRDQVAGSTPWGLKKGVDAGTKFRHDESATSSE
jgi:hypothetical protein